MTECEVQAFSNMPVSDYPWAFQQDPVGPADSVNDIDLFLVCANFWDLTWLTCKFRLFKTSSTFLMQSGKAYIYKLVSPRDFSKVLS